MECSTLVPEYINVELALAKTEASVRLNFTVRIVSYVSSCMLTIEIYSVVSLRLVFVESLYTLDLEYKRKVRNIFHI